MIDIGTKINSWTYLRPSDSTKNYGWFACDCGETRCVSIYTVVKEQSKSCGHCAWNKHGLTQKDYNSIIYARRRAINRCYNPQYAQYARYGGRGIKVCDEWLESQEKFVEWAVKSGFKSGLSLDRIDNDKEYSPQNCRWATPKQQANNRSVCIYLEHNGVTKTMMEWCEEYGVPHHLPLNRWKRGVTRFEDLFSLVDRGTGAMLHY